MSYAASSLVGFYRWDSGESNRFGTRWPPRYRFVLTPRCCAPIQSESTVNGPLKCFNPSKNWHLGWYRDKALEIGLGESWTGRLVAFVDYELADPSMNEFVLLRLNDFLFVQYNRAKAFNAGTSLHRDKVVVVIGRGGLSSSSSVLRAGLGRRERSTWKGITIQV